MRIKNFVMGFGIFVIYALALWQGIETFYPSPEWDDFCDDFRAPKVIPENRNFECPTTSQALRDKESACWEAEGQFRYEYDDNGCIVDGFCDECSINYNDARDVYSRNVFILSVIIGVITFVIGFTLLSVEPVGSALLASGIWSLFFGTVINWRNFSNAIRFVLLILVLVLLIWVAFRLNTRGYLFRKKGVEKRRHRKR